MVGMSLVVDGVDQPLAEPAVVDESLDDHDPAREVSRVSPITWITGASAFGSACTNKIRRTQATPFSLAIST